VTPTELGDMTEFLLLCAMDANEGAIKDERDEGNEASACPLFAAV